MLMKKTFKLVLTKKVLKQLNQLDNSVKLRIIREIQFLPIDPMRVGKPLTDCLSGLWSLRVGKHRVVYRVLDDSVIVHTVELRKKVYDK
jgi:mRNA-degrading endonuclease RelE of RelBE toxin-antitoxin system